MGLGSFVGKVFGSGASSATADAKKLSAEGMALNKELFDTVQPGILRGLDAQEQLFDNIRDPEAIAGFYGDVFDSMNSGSINDNILQPIMNDRLDTAKQVLSSSGLRRSGTAAREAARIPTDVKLGFGQDLINKILAGLGNVTQSGVNYLGGAQNALQGFMNAGNLGVDASLGAAERKTDILSGLLGAGSSILTAGSGSVIGGLLSDPRLKTNIEKIGEYGDLNVYKWDWKEGVEKNLGELASMKIGFLSDEVVKKYPQHVSKINVHGVDLEAIDYQGVIEDIAA